jgi:hypothetical protein
MQLILNFLYNKRCPYENTCSLDELDEKPNHTKCQSFEILKEKTTCKILILQAIWQKKLCSMGSKCLALGVGHMCKK